MKRVLLVDDDKAVREALGQTFLLAGFDPVVVGSYIEAKDHIARAFEGVVVSDIRMPGKDGFDLLALAKDIDETLPVIMLTGEGDIPMAVRAMNEGAFEFLEKPCAPNDIIAAAERALVLREAVMSQRSIQTQQHQADAASRILLGQSELADRVRRQARLAARTTAPVILTGDPGNGIYKVAEVIHLLSKQSQMPFVKVDAAALTDVSLPDILAQAAGGSLYLEEVTGLAPVVQSKLLAALEADDTLRVIAGSTRNVQDAVETGQFNADLFYKLDAVHIHTPALRDRVEDIPILFRHYVALACEQADLPMPEITQDVLARLMAQEWPGNARALMNAAMRFAMGMTEPAEVAELGLVEQMAQVERSLLIDALRRHKGVATSTAQALKLPRKTFYDKLTRHGIRAEDYRA